MSAVRKFKVRGEPLSAAGIAKKYDIPNAESDRILAEFVEMPGLRLTAAQAQRLWNMTRQRTEALLDALVDDGFLERTRDGTYRRVPLRRDDDSRSRGKQQ